MPPTYIVGNLWDEIGTADLLLVTTNSSLRKDGSLVMGRGAAFEAKERYPKLPYALGEGIKSLPTKIYGLALWTDIYDQGTLIGAFQVKYVWQDDALLELIAYSAGFLQGVAWDYKRIAMNFPGIGNGRLSRPLAEIFLTPLPSHVYVYTKE